MRTITKNPSRVIPDIRESDRYNSFILVTISIPSNNGNIVEQVACLINTERGPLNWYGDDLTSEGYEWFWDDGDNPNLVDFIIKCWKAWSDRGNIVKIYIIENADEVIPTLDNIGVPYGILRDSIVACCPDKMKPRGE